MAAGFWLQESSHLIRISVLVLVPLIVGIVTWLSNVSNAISFLLFPPIAAGTYTLFAAPDRSSPRRFVMGITAGGVCGWISLEAILFFDVAVVEAPIPPEGAALSVLLAGIVTWIIKVEEPSAYSTALLVLVTGVDEITYVFGIATSSLLVAIVFILWRDQVYQKRAEFLYRKKGQSEHVLVPMWENESSTLAHIGGKVAAESPSSRVILLGRESETQSKSETVAEIEEQAEEIESKYNVVADVIIIPQGSDTKQLLSVAADTNCTSIVTSYNPDNVKPLEKLFKSNIEIIGVETTPEKTEWQSAMVGVMAADVANQRLAEIGSRIASETSLCYCVPEDKTQREGRQMVTALAESVDRRVNTVVTGDSPQVYFNKAASEKDLLIIGASTDRGTISRTLVPPTYFGLDVDCDIAVVHQPGN